VSSVEPGLYSHSHTRKTQNTNAITPMYWEDCWLRLRIPLYAARLRCSFIANGSCLGVGSATPASRSIP
jgi:hypothetical protein